MSDAMNVNWHRFVILEDEILTLDTVAECNQAASWMAEAGVYSLPVRRGGPEQDESDGSDFLVLVEDGKVTWSWGRS